MKKQTKKTLVKIKELFMQGYGGPDTWEFTVSYRLWILETKRTTSERSLDLLKARLRRKWRHKTVEELEALVANKKPDRRPCSVCGAEDPGEGGASNSTTTWCSRCYRKLKKQEEEARENARYCLQRTCACYGQGPLLCACRPDAKGNKCAACDAWLYPLLSLYSFKYLFKRVQLGKLRVIPFRGRPPWGMIETGQRVRLVATDSSTLVVRIAKHGDGILDVETTSEQPPPHLPFNHVVLQQVQMQEQHAQYFAGRRS